MLVGCGNLSQIAIVNEGERGTYIERGREKGGDREGGREVEEERGTNVVRKRVGGGGREGEGEKE